VDRVPVLDMTKLSLLDLRSSLSYKFSGFWIFGAWDLVGPRIIILEALVVRGPFKYFSHPNYMVVAEVITSRQWFLGLVWVAVVFTVLNAAMLWVRMVEPKALATSSGLVLVLGYRVPGGLNVLALVALKFPRIASICLFALLVAGWLVVPALLC
jgi:methyltransferase